MATSQNGWVVLDGDTTGKQPRLRNWVLPGVDRKLKARDGSAGFLLAHLALWFDNKVEVLDRGKYDDWGWAARDVRGSSTPSNHSSGTAIDLNATQHPMGVPTARTFTKSEIALIHKRLDFYNDCIRWGGDYKSRPDAMHFEINKGMPAVEARARKLTKSGRGKALIEANPGARAVIFG